MPQSSGKKRRARAYKHEEAMAQPNTVTVCVRMPELLHEQLVEAQANHMHTTGSAMSRNSLILNILSRHVESGRGVLT